MADWAQLHAPHTSRYVAPNLHPTRRSMRPDWLQRPDGAQAYSGVDAYSQSLLEIKCNSYGDAEGEPYTGMPDAVAVRRTSQLSTDALSA